MRVLFVHGMGRSPFSGLTLLLRLRQAGLKTETFGYTVTFGDFNAIAARLKVRLLQTARADDDYVLVGHSLGGVLLRAAINSLPEGTKLPQHVYLLGSPMHPSRIASRLKNNIIYRTMTGDCGQLLGSTERMETIGAIGVATTCIAGIRGIGISPGSFGDEANDGIVSVSEITAPWISRYIEIPVIHAFLPSNKRVAEIIINDLTNLNKSV